ncbi:anti-sigma-factor antagonist [Candidatus Koribacter versatilis Ellin345]|uniref:Anti-sigma-factor antagonist n=1 Tax=Koribacter versatilis (strain Ellin345) TaxID=204669 RepID=Q1IJF3_KORVE|nr:STAS domain-containing protein [Candidatus Koribacter versatilis]ABF42997.1 anti-sigma-factor antagonist [Candidatus Koribacter versatilis Ellin345]
MLQLQLDPRSGEQTAILHCQGRIVFHEEAKTLAEAVRALIEKHKKVVLDLTHVRDVDSAGLGTLASLHLYARERGHEFVLMNPVTFVRDLLELTQLDRELNVLNGSRAMEFAA